jgi:hypothetical protein
MSRWDAFQLQLTNGNKGRLRYPTPTGHTCPGSLVRQLADHGGYGGYGTCFCSPGTKLVAHYACRGTELIANHIFIPEYKFYALLWRGPGLSPLRICLGSRSKSKNRDKQLTHIVRVELNPASRSGLCANLHF